MTPKISRFSRFAMDKNGIFCLNSVFLLASIPPELEDFLLGLLNSSVIEFLLTILSTKINGLYYRNSVKNLSQIPIPLENTKLIKPINEIVKEIARRIDDHKEFSDLEEEHNSVTYRLFDMSGDEIEIVENFRKWRKKLLDKPSL